MWHKVPVETIAISDLNRHSPWYKIFMGSPIVFKNQTFRKCRLKNAAGMVVFHSTQMNFDRYQTRNNQQTTLKA